MNPLSNQLRSANCAQPGLRGHLSLANVRVSPAVWMFVWLAVLALLSFGAWAASPTVPPGPDSAAALRSPGPGGARGGVVDPPARVGRVSEVVGKLWQFSPESGQWVEAVRNQVVTQGDRLATDAGARAEIWVGSSSFRLDSGTELEAVSLNDSRVVLRLHNGSLAARFRSADAVRDFELVTGEGRVALQRAGRYRFDRRDEASHVTVSTGQAQYQGPGAALAVYSGQRAEFWVDGQGKGQYSLTSPIQDEFAAWVNARDQAESRSAWAQYVSPEMTGADDLDRHGRWERGHESGVLWVPHSVPMGWAPYSHGRWAWVHPWGWTWVDDAPWGFAPFHYGRWVWHRSRWCWSPGRWVHRPVFAPALVVWASGKGVNVSVNLNLGGRGHHGPVGWFPLAPGELYVPGYRSSPRYVQEVNVTHVTNITNITQIINSPGAVVQQNQYANRGVNQAWTVMAQDRLFNRAAVQPAAQAWRESEQGRDWRADKPSVWALWGAPTRPPVAPTPGGVASGGSAAAGRVVPSLNEAGAAAVRPVPPPPGVPGTAWRKDVPKVLLTSSEPAPSAEPKPVPVVPPAPGSGWRGARPMPVAGGAGEPSGGFGGVTPVVPPAQEIGRPVPEPGASGGSPAGRSLWPRSNERPVAEPIRPPVSAPPGVDSGGRADDGRRIWRGRDGSDGSGTVQPGLVMPLPQPAPRPQPSVEPAAPPENTNPRRGWQDDDRGRGWGRQEVQPVRPSWPGFSGGPAAAPVQPSPPAGHAERAPAVGWPRAAAPMPAAAPQAPKAERSEPRERNADSPAEGKPKRFEVWR